MLNSNLPKSIFFTIMVITLGLVLLTLRIRIKTKPSRLRVHFRIEDDLLLKVNVVWMKLTTETKNTVSFSDVINSLLHDELSDEKELMIVE